MTKTNITLDDHSPLLSYAPATSWRAITPNNDGETSKYANGTGTGSWKPGATMNFTFNGTAIWVYGAKRDNHGSYTVNLDNITTTINGFDSSNQFQQLLFGSSGLSMGAHRISFVNEGPLNGAKSDWIWFDIDTVIWETEFEGPGGPVDAIITEATFDCTHPRFQYLPSSSWVLNNNVNQSFGGSTYTASSDSAVAQFTFDGDAVALYGSLGQTSGPYSASVDGKFLARYTTNYEISLTQQMLYYAEGLGAGSHTLKIENDPAGNQNQLTIDYVRTWTAKGGSGGNSDDNTPSSNNSNLGPIVGGVVGGVVTIALFLLGLFLLLRRRGGDRDPPRRAIKDLDLDSEDPHIIPFQTSSHQMNPYQSHSDYLRGPTKPTDSPVVVSHITYPHEYQGGDRPVISRQGTASTLTTHSDLSTITTTNLLPAVDVRHDPHWDPHPAAHITSPSSEYTHATGAASLPISGVSHSPWQSPDTASPPLTSFFLPHSSSIRALTPSDSAADPSTIEPFVLPTRPTPYPNHVDSKLQEVRGASIPSQNRPPQSQRDPQSPPARPLIVDGREVDFGPVPIFARGEDEEGDEYGGILPPDYAQAIQSWRRSMAAHPSVGGARPPGS